MEFKETTGSVSGGDTYPASSSSRPPPLPFACCQRASWRWCVPVGASQSFLPRRSLLRSGGSGFGEQSCICPLRNQKWCKLPLYLSADEASQQLQRVCPPLPCPWLPGGWHTDRTRSVVLQKLQAPPNGRFPLTCATVQGISCRELN